MRFSVVFVFLVSAFAGTVSAIPARSGSEGVLIARQPTNASEASTVDNSTAVNATELADTNSTSTDAGDSSGAVGGLLSGLTGTVGNVVDGVTGAVGSVADGVTGSNAVGDLLGGVTDTVNGVVNGVAGAAGSTVDGATGLKRNARRALLRRRLDARHIVADSEELA